jgi:hypothetical protein
MRILQTPQQRRFNKLLHVQAEKGSGKPVKGVISPLICPEDRRGWLLRKGRSLLSRERLIRSSSSARSADSSDGLFPPLRR